VRSGDKRVNAIDGTVGKDRIRGAGSRDTLRGLGDNDLLSGGTGADTLLGGPGADRLDGGSGNDRLDGGAGNDVLMAGTGQSNGLRAVGGAGDDVIVDSGAGDIDDGNDTPWMTSDPAGTRMFGANGDDTLYVGPAAQLVDCGPGTDRAILTSAADEALRAGRSATQFLGCEQRAAGADLGQAPTLLGALPRRRAAGVPVEDETVARALAYELSNCNLGRRRCRPGARPQRILGPSRADVVRGGGGEDFLEGAGGSDCLYGDAGDDSLFGRTGNDRLAAGDGADTIRAVGGGRDVIDCGPGKDRVEKDSRDRTRNCEIVL